MNDNFRMSFNDDPAIWVKRVNKFIWACCIAFAIVLIMTFVSAENTIFTMPNIWAS